MKLHFSKVYGKSIAPLLPTLAELRIEVFREFPYLYSGDIAYEMDYLKTYVESERSMIALAKVDGKIVGASSCVPLDDEWGDFKLPFANKGLGSDRIFYFGESIILPKFRGHNAGHRFFTMREEHAKESMPNLEYTAFCSVVRDQEHPLQPANYRSLDQFWQRMGYSKQSDMVAYTAWKDIDKQVEDKKPLVFWVKKWT